MKALLKHQRLAIAGTTLALLAATLTLNSQTLGALILGNQPTGNTNGLVGHWSMDGDTISGTTLSDQSGQGNDGTISGPVVAEGKMGQALEFDGVDDVVSTISFVGDQTNTFAYWAKTAVSDTIFGKSNAANNQIGFWGSNLRYRSDDGTTVETPSIGDLNTWNHFVFVRDGTSISFYQNSILLDTIDIGTSSDIVVNQIGARSTQSYYSGLLDDVRIYNRALSANEVYELHKEGEVKFTGSLTDPLTKGLVGYWPLDDGTGTTATDASVNGGDGTLTNGPTWTTGHIRQATEFDGTDDFVDIPMTNVLDITGDQVTLSAWINADVTSGTRRIVSVPSIETNGGEKYALLISANTLEFWTSIGTFYFNNQTPYNFTNSWHHVTGVYNGSTMKLYVDGVEQDSLNKSGNIDANISGNLQIGRYGPSYGQYFDGQIDDVRIYNRALSADEINLLYQQTSPTSIETGLVGHWTFDGQDVDWSDTSAEVKDAVGSNDGDAANMNTASAKEGVLGQALDFDDTDDYINIGSPASLETFSSITISAWIRPGSIDSNNMILSKWQTYYMYLTSDKLWFRTNDLTNDTLESLGTISKDNWHHIALTWDGAMKKIYINGNEDNSVAATGTISGTTYDVNIGAYTNNSLYFNGAIDDVRIYNRALTADEVYDLYKKGEAKVSSSHTDPLTKGLVGYWPLDDGTGTTATDASVNGNDGTLTNGPTWTSGQIEQAVEFDGIDDWVDLSSPEPLQITGPITLSAWVYDANSGGDRYSRIITKFGSTSDQGWELTRQQASDKMHFAIAANATTTVEVASTLTIPGNYVNQWVHWVGVYVPGTGLYLYRNGVLDNSNITSIPSSQYNSSSNVGIGKYLGNDSSNGHHDGLIDDVRIYNRALSADEIKLLYKQTAPTEIETGLIGHWTFDGQDVDWSDTSAEVKDAAGSNNGDAANMTAASATEGKLGQAMSFDGVDDEIVLDNLTDFDLSQENAFTVSAWVRPTNASGNSEAIVSRGGINGGVANDIYYLAIYNSDPTRWQIGISDGVSEPKIISAVGTVDLNEWQLMTGTWDGNDLILYKNGSVLDTSSNPGFTLWDGNESVDRETSIGSDARNENDYFTGQIDDVRVYNRALTATEVEDLYLQGK